MIKRLAMVFMLAMPLVAGCREAAVVQTPTPLPTATHTPEPSPTIDWFPRTATPTRQVVYTPTPERNIEVPAYTNVLIEDGFLDPEAWQLGGQDAGTVDLKDGSLSMAVSAEKGRLNSLSSYRLPSNFYLELNMRTSLCSEDDRYGIYFWRFSQMGTLTLWFNCQGQFSLEREINGGRSVLIPWTNARRFMPEAPARNQLGLWAQDGSLYLFINGVFQTEFKARPDMEGRLGFLAEAAGSMPETVLFSQLRVSTP